MEDHAVAVVVVVVAPASVEGSVGIADVAVATAAIPEEGLGSLLLADLRVVVRTVVVPPVVMPWYVAHLGGPAGCEGETQAAGSVGMEAGHDADVASVLGGGGGAAEGAAAARRAGDTAELLLPGFPAEAVRAALCRIWMALLVIARAMPSKIHARLLGVLVEAAGAEARLAVRFLSRPLVEAAEVFRYMLVPVVGSGDSGKPSTGATVLEAESALMVPELAPALGRARGLAVVQ